jgi:hypothetical protein
MQFVKTKTILMSITKCIHSVLVKIQPVTALTSSRCVTVTCDRNTYHSLGTLISMSKMDGGDALGNMQVECFHKSNMSHDVDLT